MLFGAPSQNREAMLVVESKVKWFYLMKRYFLLVIWTLTTLCYKSAGVQQLGGTGGGGL